MPNDSRSRGCRPATILDRRHMGIAHNVVGKLVVNPGNENMYTLEIFTITGRLIFHRKKLSGVQTIDFEEKSGVLIIRKLTDNQTSVLKFVVNSST